MSRRASALSWAVVLGTLAASGCDSPEPAESAAAQRPAVVLADATEGSGIDFVHDNAASEDKLLPETMGSGVAIFDADRDGLPDVLLIDGGSLVDAGRASRLRLFRNLGGLRFADATAESGLELPFYGMGAAVGDVDGDDALDLLVTGVGGTRLFRGRGDGGFEDVTRRWGLPTEDGFQSSAAFFDRDGDGDLDLFLARYVEWSVESDRTCRPDGVHRVYCTPEVYPSIPNLYFENLGDRFVDATEESGLDVPGKALGVAVLDVDGDARLDLAVANDTVPNRLFLNRDGGFQEVGAESGFALGAASAARGGMGVAAGDLDGDLREDVVVGNFANEMAAYFRATGEGTFEDRAAAARLGMPTLVALAFGTVVADFDNDGRLDVAFANGHIEPSIGEITDGRESWAQPLQVFHNLDGAFELVENVPDRPLVGRGLASGDLDVDGDLDLVVTQNGGRTVVLRNDSPGRDWLRLRLRGPGANTWGLGAEVSLELDDGTTRLRRLEPSGSYLSSSEPVLQVGLGGDSEAGVPGSTVRRIVVRWPGGGVDELESPESGRLLELTASDASSTPGAR